MRFHFFTVDALAPAAGANELNAFCAQHRVAAVDKQFIAQGAHSYWLFCLTTVEADGAERAAASGGKRARIDYREVLSEGDFAVYAELRELRKTIAEHDGLPIYALFTNEQLAEMVTRRATTLAALGEIEGVGKARVEKYGELFVTLLGKSFAEAAPGVAAPVAPLSTPGGR